MRLPNTAQWRPPLATLAFMGCMIVLGTTFRMLEYRDDPQMTTPGVLGTTAGSTAFAGWPVSASRFTKVAYLLRQAPQLVYHVHVAHW
jgi:hypothetical protein